MEKGIIVAPQPEAAEAGAEVLRAGGNAVDAAVACALVQGVVDPQMCGIAGFGSLHIFLPERGAHLLIDAHGVAPLAAREDMWAHLLRGETPDGFGFVLEGQVNDMGYGSITVPGSLKAYHEAQSAYGSWSWHDVLQPAIAQADAGFVVRPHVHYFWTELDDPGRAPASERLRCTEAGRRIYCKPDGSLYRVGERLRNPDLARSLRRLATGGVELFYAGEMAGEIADDMAQNGGLITRDDLKSYRTTTTEPLWCDYRGRRLATNQPPGGGLMLVEMLNILEHFDLAALGHNTPAYIRVVAEAMKQATRDKDAHVGDPAFIAVPIDRLTSKAYAAEAAARIERGEKVGVERLAHMPEGPHTTHLSVVDAAGNAVSMTHSLGMSSGVVTPGLGFMYNNCMSVFDPRPGHTGSIRPGKARFSSICPSILFENGEPCLVLGAPGGTQIAMGVLQAILNVVDFGMTALEAVSAPRFSAVSGAIAVSNRIPTHVTRELEAEGYVVQRSPYSFPFASVHALLKRDGVWSGGADPNHDGMALAV